MANPYEPPQSRTKLDAASYERRFTISPFAVGLFTVVAITAAVLVLPAFSLVRENRSYELTVILQSKVPLGHAIPRFALCETRDEAMKLEQFCADPETEAKRFGTDSESVIARSKMIGECAFRLDVLAGATARGMFTLDEYEHNWFVVQYETADGVIHRKAVQIVKGPRPRMMRVVIP